MRMSGNESQSLRATLPCDYKIKGTILKVILLGVDIARSMVRFKSKFLLTLKLGKVDLIKNEYFSQSLWRGTQHTI